VILVTFDTRVRLIPPRVVAFLRRALRPVMSVVDSKNLTSFLSIDDIVLVAHLQPEDSNLFDRFTTMARQFHDRYSFAVARGVQSQLGISCYNNLDDTQRSTAELSTVESLENFVRLCSTPVIPELTRRNERQYLTVRYLED
jgi:protein disulfide-isomerase A1